MTDHDITELKRILTACNVYPRTLWMGTHGAKIHNALPSLIAAAEEQDDLRDEMFLRLRERDDANAERDRLRERVEELTAQRDALLARAETAEGRLAKAAGAIKPLTARMERCLADDYCDCPDVHICGRDAAREECADARAVLAEIEERDEANALLADALTDGAALRGVLREMLARFAPLHRRDEGLSEAEIAVARRARARRGGQAMSANSKIEWTDHTFNIAWGCTKVSAGCAHCYADKFSHRYGFDVWGAGKSRRIFGETHWREPLKWDRAARAAGRVDRVFCSSMCDVFEDHPTIDEEREKLWPLIQATPNLVWQLLTKRPERIAANLPACWDEIRGRVWLGTSAEDQPTFVARWPHLRDTPAAVRFLSVEPLLGPVDTSPALSGFEASGTEYGRGFNHTRVGRAVPKVDLVIVGGESGPGARPCDVAWIRSIVKQCRDANVPAFVKQVGAHYVDAANGVGGVLARPDPTLVPPIRRLRDRKGGDPSEWPQDLRVREMPEAPDADE